MSGQCLSLNFALYFENCMESKHWDVQSDKTQNTLTEISVKPDNQ